MSSNWKTLTCGDFLNVPGEMTNFNQWICWRYAEIDGRQTKIPLRPIDGHKASVTNPLDWSNFGTAYNAAKTNGVGLGFVFTKSDPFVGIDLDNPENDVEIDRVHWNTKINCFNSYTEISPSGKGRHIIVKGVLPGKGRRRGKIEMYDNERFFTMTGNSVPILGQEIQDRQDLIEILYQELAPNVDRSAGQGMDVEIHSDERVLQTAFAAKNSEKFTRLWFGNWKADYGNKSQSEADQALINIIGFYSRHLDQTVRLFRQSGLGQRGKAKRDTYVLPMARKAMPAPVPPIPGWHPQAA